MGEKIKTIAIGLLSVVTVVLLIGTVFLYKTVEEQKDVLEAQSTLNTQVIQVLNAIIQVPEVKRHLGQ